MLGTPGARGSGAAAARSARATALNWASTMWCGLRPVHVQVQADARRRRQRLEEVPGQRGVVGADQRRHAVRLGVHQVRPAGQVDGGPGQRLVQRHDRVAEPADARLVAERLAQRLAQRQRGVLDRVVRVDLDVAAGLDAQVEQAVLGQLGEHVVEERHAGAHLGRAGAVEVQLDQDLVSLVTRSTRAVRLIAHVLRPAQHLVEARRGTRPSRPAVPTVTRSQPGGPVSRISTPRSSSPCQTACRSANSPNSTKLASESATARPRPRSQATRSSRSARSAPTVASGSSRCASAARATAWVTRGQVVGQPDQQQRLDHRRDRRPGSRPARRPARTPWTWCG